VRIVGTLCYGLAVVILIVTLSLAYQGRQDFGYRKTGSAIVICLLLAAGVTITRATTRQKHLIRELRSSQRRAVEFHDLLYTTLASIGDAVIATDAKGIITFLNPEAQRISGWAGEEAVGQPLSRVFAITNRYTRAIIEDPATVVLGETSVGRLPKNTDLTSKDGRVIPIGDSSAPIRDKAGNIIGIVLVFRDLTEVKKAEEARLNLASIVESSNDAIIGELPDGTITS
jgi:PAS domain S-box-containing protein